MAIKYAPSVEEKKLLKVGSSVVITLPQEWLKENNVGAGDKVIMSVNGNIEIMRNDENKIKELNEKIMKLRDYWNQDNTSNHIPRSDDDRTGETREASVSQTNNNSLR